MDTHKKHIVLDGIDPLALLGQNDRYLSLLEHHYGVRAVVRGTDLWLTGSSDAVTRSGVAVETIAPVTL